jgi:hypothetical protein
MKSTAYLFLLICMASCYGKKPDVTGKEGEPIPTFSLLLTDSTTSFDTRYIPDGKPVVLIYFSPYCPYSRAQIEEVTKHITELKNINIYAFTSMPFSAMKAFYNNYHLDKYSNITCGNDSKSYFKSYFQIPGVPYIAIYGKDKKLKQSYVGLTEVRHIKEIAEE